ncbi:hypothetical protein [Paraliomyxa miuraensis]|uniref:hypothetical protein n=1 Tax=Paraliomyxa miuraensis TaxID=376150 RepID=UPI0022535441|nr:hypothetical protein [Paraliomyxa miuraensis]MCX4245868.1 hypothetical protein [Paraliomyxa miuraensis]
MASNGYGLPTWKKLGAFQVFGDYAPMQGFRVLLQIGADPESLLDALERRATRQDLLDPDLARASLRAGLGLLRTGLPSFVYATVEEVIVMLHAEVSSSEGAVVQAQSRLLSEYASALSLLLGLPAAAGTRLYEVPDVEVARRALVSLVEDVEEATPLRSAMWLGAQLKGRGQPFHPSMVETLEEQSHLLQSNGIDMDALPAWWWRGVAARPGPSGVEVFDELPGGDELGNLLES